MGITEILTIIFVLCKLFGVISWSWWLVLLPEIVAFCIYIIFLICMLLGIGKAHKDVKKEFGDWR